MSGVTPEMFVEAEIFQIVNDGDEPMTPSQVDNVLYARHGSISQVLFRDAMWSLIHQGKVRLTNDRKLARQGAAQ